LESTIQDLMHGRIVKNFLDMVILMELRKRSMSSADVVAFVQNKFNITLSLGTVYSNLCFLEKNGLIKGEEAQKRKIYTLTNKGKGTAEAFLSSNDRILGLMLNLFIGE